MDQNQQLPAVITPQQRAWISLAEGKNNLMSSLQGKEQQASILLQNLNRPEVVDYKIIEEGLMKYRKLHSEMIEERKGFTKIIDEKIVQSVMIPEKNVDPSKNNLYHELNNKAFKLKKEESDKVTKANAKNQEKANFITHANNEFIRIVGLYKAFNKNEIVNIYESNLKAKIKDPAPAIDQFKAWIATTKPPQPNGFMPQYLTREEMQEIYSDDSVIPKPDWSKYLNESLAYMDELFLNYETALANADAAVTHVKQEVAIANMEEKEVDNKEMALNTLSSSAQAVQIQGPVIKKTLVVRKSKGWDWDWTQKILAAFYVNIANLEKYVRVKDSGNLKVSQMADALGKYATETGVVAKDVIYDEIEK